MNFEKQKLQLAFQNETQYSKTVKCFSKNVQTFENLIVSVRNAFVSLVKLRDKINKETSEITSLRIFAIFLFSSLIF